MYYSDHPPPHFHAIYGDQEAIIGIRPIKMLAGRLPKRGWDLIRAWARLHQEELAASWERARSGEVVQPIAPLESNSTMVITRIKSVEVAGPHSLRLEFDDGVRKRVNVLPLLRGPVFKPLLDPNYFQRVLLDPVAGTVVWPNGADLAPEALHHLPSEEATIERSTNKPPRSTRQTAGR